MKISESIEAHLSSAVAGISQRNQATLSKQVIEHPIRLTVFHRLYHLYRLAKASGFCLSFYTNLNQFPIQKSGWRKQTIARNFKEKQHG
ncbi:MAG: hypothetical protein IJM92_18900 [Fibrobacter sp.]|uniref:hypothetical protein n=1 Tax=Fibrobacter sp. TaxID=35828 RepID=UPI0025B95661|nr:hypothetical protein [Fibrobacter sp.]MBQ7081684.1 hypothetical protein [Fibrobacter sp.]